MNALFDEYTI
ncbi:hypothetical protein YPPY113_4319, partial [Yersinia pestis PY-113]